MPGIILLVAATLVGALPCRAQIDTAINLTVWKMLYGVTDAQASDPAWLARDDDGDGTTNGGELIAGTNPFDATSHPAVTTTALGGGNVSLSFTTAPGKLYSLQSSPALGSTANWTTVSSVAAISGDGTAKTLSAAQATGTAFYRVAIQDQDTDGDGVSDWAEKITGFDPTTAHTHGATEDDHTALANDLLQENVVTVTATKPTATQPADAVTAASDTATITITRGGTLHFSAITVPLTWSGTAVSGVDFAPLPTSVTFPAKVGVITLTVTPLANAARLSPGTVTAVAMPGGGYKIGSAHAASAVISPAGNTSGTGLTGQYWNTTSSGYTPYSPTATNVFATAPKATPARFDGGLCMVRDDAAHRCQHHLFPRTLERAGAAAVFGDLLFRCHCRRRRETLGQWPARHRHLGLYHVRRPPGQHHAPSRPALRYPTRLQSGGRRRVHPSFLVQQ